MALTIALIVIAIIVGTIFTLRTTTRVGMPPKDVLDRAARRSRELEARDKAGGNEQSSENRDM